MPVLAVGDKVSLRASGSVAGAPGYPGFATPPVIGIISAQVGDLQFITWESPGEATITQGGVAPFVLDRISIADLTTLAFTGRYLAVSIGGAPPAGAAISAEFSGICIRTYKRVQPSAAAPPPGVDFVVIRTDRGAYLEVLASDVFVKPSR